MGGGLESRCVGRVYGADGAVRLRSGSQDHHPSTNMRPSSRALDVELQHMVFCTEFLDWW